jgi:hypothetical protein
MSICYYNNIKTNNTKLVLLNADLLCYMFIRQHMGVFLKRKYYYFDRLLLVAAIIS